MAVVERASTMEEAGLPLKSFGNQWEFAEFQNPFEWTFQGCAKNIAADAAETVNCYPFCHEQFSLVIIFDLHIGGYERNSS